MRRLSLLVWICGPLSAMGQLWVSDDARGLWKLDVQSGAATKVGTMPASMNDIAFAPWGDLYGIAHPDDIYRIKLDEIDGHGNIPAYLKIGRASCRERV